MMVWLQRCGHFANRKRVQRLMKLLGLETVYTRQRTSDPDAGHRTFPYLLRDAVITHGNQAWAADITYVPMTRGFLYLVTMLD